MSTAAHTDASHDVAGLVEKAQALSEQFGFDAPYLDLLEQYLRLFDVSRDGAGEVSVALAKQVAADLYARMATPLARIDDEGQIPEYRALYQAILRDVDDVIIRWARGSVVGYMLDFYALKYDCTVEDLFAHSHVKENNWYTKVGDSTIALRTVDRLNKALVFDFLTIRDGMIRLELHSGFIDERAKDSVVVKCIANGKRYRATFVRRLDQKKPAAFPEFETRLAGYVVEVPWDGATDLDLSFKISFKRSGQNVILQFAKFFAINKEFKHNYWDTGGAIVRYHEDEKGVAHLTFTKSTPPLRRELESMLQEEILATLEDKTIAKQVCAWRKEGFKARERRRRSQRQVWLISDRPTKAGDNGEAVFAYLRKHPIRGVKPFFVLSKDADDWARLSRMGKVLDLGSEEYRKTFLKATHIVHSSGEEWPVNAFGAQRHLMRDLFEAKSVFLQHGITTYDMSGWINRYNKNFDMIVTSGVAEQQSMQGETYAYDGSVIRRTGFPRHDSLLHEATRRKPQKIVYLMPTWRKSLIEGAYDTTKGCYPSNPHFEESKYYQFYQSLISDPRLLAALKRNGYSMRFVMHPSFVQEADKFIGNDVVTILPRCDYREAFVSGSLLVTDYSSVVFDFALLAKPIIYTQFDVDTILEGHTYQKGYFNDEQQGFGPVCHGLRESVSAIITCVEDGCVMRPMYWKRVYGFFGSQPGSRCQAVTEAIRNL